MTTSRSFSPEPSYTTAEATPRPSSPAALTSVASSSRTEQQQLFQPEVLDKTLKPGVYRIVNDSNPDFVVDLSGQDLKTVITFGSHGGKNQQVLSNYLSRVIIPWLTELQWEFSRLGPGYSIRCLYNGAYITLGSGISEGGNLIATPYPVSWAIEADDFEAGVYRIRWPESPFVFDYPGGTGYTIQLSDRYPFKPTRLWRLVPVKIDVPKMAAESFEFTTSAPRRMDPAPALITNADTVIDAEGLKLGGNGELSITTTTTTVTTSVTTVKRLGVP
ncbi:hypothetical protein NLJ89_g7073 [Agrocybe chaxingu]|uniref:Uncharacterized protein n=1 Tax=Agrocybe chaxingu TaxID=84603 RepID=A0A9W8MS33_9AGAR|nr:hypothetical protein NLJ89_g7073 [Agrocybe chaxingu]